MWLVPLVNSQPLGASMCTEPLKQAAVACNPALRDFGQGTPMQGNVLDLGTPLLRADSLFRDNDGLSPQKTSCPPEHPAN